MKFASETIRRALLKELARDVYGLKADTASISHFVDIGANAGLVAIMARLLHPLAKVTVFEPDALTYRCLRDNIRGLNIDSRNLALGDGRPVSLVPVESRTVKCLQFAPGRGSESVSSMTLDGLLDGVVADPATAMLKVDCEGGEWHLMGHEPSETLLRRFGRVAMEVHVVDSRSMDMFEEWAGGVFKAGHELCFERSAKEPGRIAFLRAKLQRS